MFSGYVLCMSPQRRMNFIWDRYAKKWLVMPRGQTLSFGSSVSRSQSPSRLTLSAVRASAAPGNAASHHATYRKSRLSDSMLSERSEEHTSELQSQSNLVCRLLLEKKKKKQWST